LQFGRHGERDEGHDRDCCQRDEPRPSHDSGKGAATLGIKTPGKVAFVLGEGGTTIIKPGLTMLDLRATLPALPGASVDFDKEIAEAMDEAADRRMAKMRRQ